MTTKLTSDYNVAPDAIQAADDKAKTTSLNDLAQLTDYSLLENLTCDPDATDTGLDHRPRQVFSGHYVPVVPTPIENPEYIIHSKALFEELGFDDSLAQDESFTRLFSGDVSHLPEPMRQYGWATGYALSIYGTEYDQQCPFRTGNGYGDGRAISVIEVVANNKRWEMQLKGGGPTPYCRGADGRAVLRSSVREFLAQEYMHALGVPTSRSLSLYVSKTETVDRPWYIEGSQSTDPEIMVSNPVAISTRVAPSFLRVGQLELFARRARKHSHPDTFKELELIVLHLIEREYKNEIDETLSLPEKVIALAHAFRDRLVALVSDWVRVGYCQGNFNSDNCAAGGYTLDYGPFGFMELFDPVFQPWTGGGRHFSFLNQPLAAEKNFDSFCSALKPLLSHDEGELAKLTQIRESFPSAIEANMRDMWAAKLGLETFEPELFITLMQLMVKTKVDYTLFFRELSHLPTALDSLYPSFYRPPTQQLQKEWLTWFENWQALISEAQDKPSLSEQMKRVNPKYTWREWLIVPAYENAAKGDYALIKELHQVFSNPYDEQSTEIENKYYRLRPDEFMRAGGVSHYSCSS